MRSRDATANRRCQAPDPPEQHLAAKDRTPSDDWSALMTGSQGGDQRAYLTLLKAITPYLRALARRAGLGADEIEDGVQDVLMTIHALRFTYDPKRLCTPWVVAVASDRLGARAGRRSRMSASET